MKQLKRIISIVLLSILCFCSFDFTSRAAEQSYSSAEYDLTIGGTQSFCLLDDNNDLLIITITEEENVLRLDDKTYSVSFKSPLTWEAGYKVVVNDNLITSVHSAWYKTVTGTILTSRLVKESTKQATYYLSYQLLGVVTPAGVRTIISGTTMSVDRI